MADMNAGFFFDPPSFYLGAPVGGVDYLELPFGIVVPVPYPAR